MFFSGRRRGGSGRKKGSIGKKRRKKKRDNIRFSHDKASFIVVVTWLRAPYFFLLFGGRGKGNTYVWRHLFIVFFFFFLYLQTYSMDLYFRQSWIDKRLAFKGNKETLALSITMLEKIWKPDTYFYNGKQSYLHTITTPNKFVRLYQDGRVLYSSR